MLTTKQRKSATFPFVLQNFNKLERAVLLILSSSFCKLFQCNTKAPLWPFRGSTSYTYSTQFVQPLLVQNQFTTMICASDLSVCWEQNMGCLGKCIWIRLGNRSITANQPRENMSALLLSHLCALIFNECLPSPGHAKGSSTPPPLCTEALPMHTAPPWHGHKVSSC